MFQRVAAGALVALAAAPGRSSSGTAVQGDAGGETLASYRRARDVVARARAVMGGAAQVAGIGGLTLEATGTLHKGAEYQGRAPDDASPGTFHERLTIETAGGRLAYAYREERYDGTVEDVREIHSGGERLMVLPESRHVVRLRGADHPEARRRLERRIPSLLLEEVWAQSASLRWLGDGAGGPRVSASLSTGEVLTLGFDARSAALTQVEYLTDVQGIGDAVVAWRFGDYAPVDGLGLFPRRYTSEVAGRVFTQMRVLQVGPADRSPLTPPDGFTVVGPIDEDSAEASAPAAVQELSPGIRRVMRLRQGVHPMFVEFADFIVALDAPAGYRLLNELPAGDVAPGPSSAWLSERYIELVKAAVPGKPIRYVVLTHFHNDHLGGVRAFVAEGATVIAPPAAAAHVRRLVDTPHTLAPDRLARSPRPLALDVVRGRRTIADASRRLDLIDVGSNPHGTEMLVAHLPGDSVMFVSDLLQPVAIERFPTPSHAALDRFFVRWLDQAGLLPDRIYSMHGAGPATPEHLARARHRRE